MEYIVGTVYFWISIPMLIIKLSVVNSIFLKLISFIPLNLLIFLLPFFIGIISFFVKNDVFRKRLLVLVGISEFFLLSASFYFKNSKNFSLEYLNTSNSYSVDYKYFNISKYLEPSGEIYVFLLLFAINFIFTIVALYNLGYYRIFKKDTKQDHLIFKTEPERIFDSFLLLFLSSMFLVILSNHIGISWVAIEATTLFSAPLIYYHVNKESLEAVWKYLIICSVGIAISLVGTFLLYAGLENKEAFFDSAIKSDWFKIGFIFVFVGYATKAGIVPMHTWLVDAHSQAPSHISALLSGALLNCAMITIYKIVKINCFCDKEFVYDVLLFFGSLTVLVSSILSLNQKEFKRLLAYSSIENMGLSLIVIGLNKYINIEYLLTFTLISHSFIKIFLFLTSGIIMVEYNQKDINKVFLYNRGLLKWMWFLGFILILGFPPSFLLMTKVLLFKILIGKNVVVFIILFISLLMVGISFSRAFINMCFSFKDGCMIYKKAPRIMYISSAVIGIYTVITSLLFILEFIRRYG